MATEPQAPATPSQRAWHARCPQCGADVALQSAATPVAVCSYCRSTLARDGDTLRRLGRSAELFDDHSPLQLGASGRWQGRPFTLIGRLQWRSEDAAWNEWVMLFEGAGDGGPATAGVAQAERAWLSEDNGRYVVVFDAQLPPRLAQVPLSGWQPGGSFPLPSGDAWQVASVVQARVVAAEGELPQPPRLDEPTTLVELRSSTGEVGTLSAVAARTQTDRGAADVSGESSGADWTVGRTVELPDLQWRGLRDATAGTAAPAQAPACPSCGAGLTITLDSTKSVACAACKAVVDVSQGVGGQLAYFAQQRSAGVWGEPLIPLGRTGTMALGGTATPWQVVGYTVRVAQPETDEDEGTPWAEYLLYSRHVGFAFLVSADDGWSWAVPLTGAPKMRNERAQWKGRSYEPREAYASQTTYVLGEFYWQVQQGQHSQHADYVSGDWRLNREQQAREVTWSDGRTLAAGTVMKAFGVDTSTAGGARDVSPLAGSAWGWRTVLVLIVVLLVAFMLLSRCGSDRCDGLRSTYGAASVEYQQCLRRAGGGGGGIVRGGGGSWGGSGSGGGHK